MKRRRFIETTGLCTAAGLLPHSFTLANKLVSTNLLTMEDIGIQLFSLPKVMEQNPEDGFKSLASMGYRKIEMYGPYPFSAQPAKDRWQSLAPRLGFSGSGYFGKGAEGFKEMANTFELSIPSAHTDLLTLQHNMDDMAKAHEVLGFDYVVLPALPDEYRSSMDDYKRAADLFNEIGKNAVSKGFNFAYHNHGYGLSEVDGQIPLQFILENTDPNYVFFEMDIFWTVAGRANPAEYLKNYPGRYHMMHVKDMKEAKTFSGDGGDPAQWMELFPFMCSAGDGVIPLDEIIPLAKENGVTHFFVEQDMVADPDVALLRSAEHLKSL